jgi:hypothetical protein
LEAWEYKWLPTFQQSAASFLLQTQPEELTAIFCFQPPLLILQKRFHSEYGVTSSNADDFRHLCGDHPAGSCFLGSARAKDSRYEYR